MYDAVNQRQQSHVWNWKKNWAALKWVKCSEHRWTIVYDFILNILFSRAIAENIERNTSVKRNKRENRMKLQASQMALDSIACEIKKKKKQTRPIDHVQKKKWKSPNQLVMDWPMNCAIFTCKCLFVSFLVVILYKFILYLIDHFAFRIVFMCRNSPRVTWALK